MTYGFMLPSMLNGLIIVVTLIMFAVIGLYVAIVWVVAKTMKSNFEMPGMEASIGSGDFGLMENPKRVKHGMHEKVSVSSPSSVIFNPIGSQNIRFVGRKS